MHGEETGRPCRHEVSGRPARAKHELSIRQVEAVSALEVHRRGEIYRKHPFESSNLDDTTLRSTTTRDGNRICRTFVWICKEQAFRLVSTTELLYTVIERSD